MRRVLKVVQELMRYMGIVEGNRGGRDKVWYLPPPYMPEY